MRLKNLILFSLALALYACGGTAENSTETNDKSAETKQDSAVHLKPELGAAETTLPNTKCISIATNDYEVEETLAEIKSTYNAGQILTVVMSTDEELFLEISYEGRGLEESWKIDVPLENRFGFDVTLEYTDANHDDVEDELVIWWNQSDGTNGMLDGFEMSNSGIIIFDVIQRNVMLNFIYDNHYASYSAGENANTNTDDYHAKMAEDSDWIICAYYYTVKLNNGELAVSAFNYDIEGDGECAITPYQEGTYRFNSTEERFEIVP